MLPDNKRQMLQSIRDSLSHVRKNHDPGDSTSQNKAESGRGDYNKEAMAKIRNQLEQFAIPSDPEGKDAGASAAATASEDAADQLRAKELVQHLYLAGKESFPRNGMSKFGGLVPPGQRPLQRKPSMEQDERPRQAQQLAPFMPPTAAHQGDNSLAAHRAASPPPPLPPPRQPTPGAAATTAAAAPPLAAAPPPLPPRSSKPPQYLNSASAVTAQPSSMPPMKKQLISVPQSAVSSPAGTNGLLTHHYAAAGSVSATAGSSSPGGGMPTLVSSLTSATAALGTGQQLQQPTSQHWQQRQQHPYSAANANVTQQPFAPTPFGAGYPGAMLAQQQMPYGAAMASTGPGRPPSPAPAALTHGQAQQRVPPPPPYSVATAASSSSSIASSVGGSSSAGDYQLAGAAAEGPPLSRPMGTNAAFPPEYRPSPPYSGSSGNCSPSTAGAPFQYSRQGIGAHAGGAMSPTCMTSPWDSRQVANGQSANFQASPLRHNAAGGELPVASASQQQALPAYQLPPHCSAPPNYYTSSVQARVGGEGGARVLGSQQQQPPHLMLPPRGNVHIQLRNQKDPCVSVTGNPSFQVTAVSAPKLSRVDPGGQQQQPAIQIQFGCLAPPHVVSEAHVPPGLLLRGMMAMPPPHDSPCGSDSPVQRTTNPSPLSILSTASNTSSEQASLDHRPPPPPYPGSGGGGGAASHAYMQTPTESDTQSEADMGWSGGYGELDGIGASLAAAHMPERCESPIPERKPEAQKKDAERRETKVQHYSPQAFKFYMEQHVENVLKQHKERIKRRAQLENEMDRASLCEETRTEMRRMLRQKESNFLRMRRAKMERGMFERIKGLGVGAFGEVALVRKNDTLQLFAMKTLRKADVLRRNQVAHVKAERDILAEAECDWVVKLFYSFQDKDNLYFIMEYIPGGDMMSMLIKFGIFEEPLARFYVGELVLAIESVHRMGFIHRDIKPDNVLIDRDGHIKLTDFGLCTGFRWTHNSKYYQNGGHARQDSMEPEAAGGGDCNCVEILKPLERRRQRERLRCLAHSLVGTPNYIAPEVLLRSGYTRTCDWWSVGVILFEMLVGRPPFLANSAQETQYKVITWERTLHVPEEANLSKHATSLILGLCCGPEQRLGTNGGADEIKKHPFFEGLTFTDLRKQRAPYKPPIKHETDTSNFDSVDDIEQHHHDDEDFRNGKYPEHAFVEFTFRRFFDDCGHPLKMTESLEKHTSDTYGGIPIHGRHVEGDASAAYAAHASDSGISSAQVNGIDTSVGPESYRSLGASSATTVSGVYSSTASSETMAHRTPENPVYV